MLTAPSERRDDDVPRLDAVLRGVPRDEVERDRGRQVRDGRDEALLEIVELHAVLRLEPADDRREEEGQRVEAVDEAEVDERQGPDATVAEDRADAVALVTAGLRGGLSGELTGQPLLLVVVEPLGLRRAVGEVEPRDDADDDGRQTDAEEHEPPALQAEDPVLADQPAGQGGADDRRERLGQVEETEDAAAVPGRDEHAEEEDRAREEAGLGDTEKEAQRRQLGEGLHEGEQHRDDAPADHDPGQPAPGPELVQGEVARDLEHDVAEEEDPRGEPELGRGEPEVGVHAARSGKADGRPVQVVDEEHQRHEGHQADGDLANSRFLDAERLRLVNGAHAHRDSFGSRFKGPGGPGDG